VSTGLLTIGRFARLMRLSVKQLRRYDELGLIAPASVDAETGYRFYHQRQARTAATVALLRELDVPLAVVRELLVADDERAAELLGAQRARRAAGARPRCPNPRSADSNGDRRRTAGSAGLHSPRPAAPACDVASTWRSRACPR